ncbi:hypothetical protein [Chitinophaga sp. YIM B06452]|uniref:hypothetical protein n=1 Tax=Chitinophaga sp. YIM B06452 TaxID=3082158 RepID=UPI0031FED67C
MNIRPYGWMLLLLPAVMAVPSALRAQLKLGANPASINKSSILELESSSQGLLLPRVPDTTVSTLAAAPDGTIVYYTPLKSILVRKDGYWRPMKDAATTATEWLLDGNTLPAPASFGTVNNMALPFITNNQERMRIAADGAIGFGTAAPTTLMHIRTGVADSSGLRLENLTSSSAVTPGAAALGVDENGKVVRANKVMFYSGGAGADGASGGTADVDEVTKVWVAEVANTSTGVQTINFPGNISFTHILGIQVTAKGGSGITDTPIAVVTSNTNNSVTVRVMEAADVTTPSLALEPHVNTSTKLYIRVEGN